MDQNAPSAVDVGVEDLSPAETNTGAQAVRAEVEKRPSGLYRAWCDAHQDGWQVKTRKSAQGWADRHNASEHGEAK